MTLRAFMIGILLVAGLASLQPYSAYGHGWGGFGGSTFPASAVLVLVVSSLVVNGVLATSHDGRIVLCQLAPWQFDYRGEKMNVKRTYRKVSCLLTRLMANMGAGGSDADS